MKDVFKSILENLNNIGKTKGFSSPEFREAFEESNQQLRARGLLEPPGRRIKPSEDLANGWSPKRVHREDLFQSRPLGEEFNQQQRGKGPARPPSTGMKPLKEWRNLDEIGKTKGFDSLEFGKAFEGFSRQLGSKGLSSSSGTNVRPPRENLSNGWSRKHGQDPDDPFGKRPKKDEI